MRRWDALLGFLSVGKMYRSRPSLRLHDSFESFLAARAGESARTALPAAAALLALFALGHSRSLSPYQSAVLVPVDVILGVLTAGLAVYLHYRRESDLVLRLAMAAFGTAMAFNTFAHFAVTGSSASVIAFIVLVGLIYQERLDHYLLAAFCVAGWIWIGLHGDFDALIRQSSLTMLSGVTFASIAFESRRSSFRSIYALESELRRLARTDQLTGLPNRAAITARISEALARVKRRMGGGFGVCFLDLDDFKGINDRYGHDAGDQVLRELAARLKSEFRESDTPARLGGDEFLLLLGDVKSAAARAAVLRRLERVSSFEIALGRNTLSVSASIGVAWSSDGYSTAEAMIQAADAEMYKAKQGQDAATPLARLSPPWTPSPDSLPRLIYFS